MPLNIAFSFAGIHTIIKAKRKKMWELQASKSKITLLPDRDKKKEVSICATFTIYDTAWVCKGFYFLKCCSLQGHWIPVFFIVNLERLDFNQLLLTTILLYYCKMTMPHKRFNRYGIRYEKKKNRQCKSLVFTCVIINLSNQMQRATLLELSFSLISELNIKYRPQMTGKPTLINWHIQKCRTSRHY